VQRLLVSLVVLVLFGSCSADQQDPQRDWLHVLNRKKAAVAANASPREKQVYADTLAAFVRKHPTHNHARAVYERIQLDFAGELASIGRYQDAIRFYRAVLAHDANNREALAGLASAVDHLALSRDKLLALEKGMSPRQVAHLLGKPIPGWTMHTEHRDTVIDSWYYRTTEGGIAGVYFRDGALFAAEANSHEKVVSLNRSF
jgi:hypothetical protein